MITGKRKFRELSDETKEKINARNRTKAYYTYQNSRKNEASDIVTTCPTAWPEGQGWPNYGSGNSAWPHHCEGGENFQRSIANFINVRTFVSSLIKVCYNLLQIRHHPNDVFSFFLDSYRGAYSEPPRIVFTSSKQFNQWRRKRIMRRFGLLSRWFTRYLSKSERTHASAMARKRTSVHTIVCIGVLYDS